MVYRFATQWKGGDGADLRGSHAFAGTSPETRLQPQTSNLRQQLRNSSGTHSNALFSTAVILSVTRCLVVGCAAGDSNPWIFP